MYVYMYVRWIVINTAVATASRGEERAVRHGEVVQRQPDTEHSTHC